MDDDENDFRSQNLHLADEGSTRFPPVLRQYALPKFDFDDSIQGHVSFDSLAESEVFLGIESNEDNQWIENFSRENSGVEFRTNETEDCCISRRKNVWSEATSSESVEMLLKSVGPEDITPSQATTEELNACDKFKQMEPIIEHGNESFSEMENIINLEPTSMPDERHEEFSGVMEPSIRHCDSLFSEMKSVLNLEPISLPGEVHETFSTVEGNTRGEMPLNVVDLKHLDGSLIHVDSPIGCVACVSPKVERFQISDWNSDLLVQSEVDPLVKISLQGNQWEDSRASGNPIDGVASSTHNLTSHSFESNNERVKLKVRIESSDGSQRGNGKREDDESGPRVEVQSDDQMASSMKNVEEKVDAGITNGDKHSNVTSKLNNESHVGVGQSEIVQSDRFDDEWKSGELGDQSEVSVVPVFSKFNRDTVEVIVSHINTEICTGRESEMVSTMTVNAVIEGRDGLQLNSDVLVSESSSSLSIMENHEVCKGKEFSNSPMRESSSFSAVSSAALGEEIHVPAALSSEFDACGALTANLKGGDVKAFFTADPIQICEDAITHAQDNVHDLHVSVSEEKGTRLIDVSVESDYQADGVQSSFSGEPGTEKNLVVSSVQCHESDRKESARSDSSYYSLLSIGDGVLPDIHVNLNKDQLSNSEVGGARMDGRDEDAVEVSAKESLSSLLDSSQLEARSCPVSCAADNTSIIISEKILSDRAGHLVPQKDNCNIEAHSEPEAEVCNEVGQHCTKERDVFPNPCETVATIGDSLDIMSDSKRIPPNNQMLTQSMAKPSLETEESNGKTLKEIGHIQTVSLSEGENNGQVVGTMTDANIDSGTNEEPSSRVAFSHSVVQESDDKPTSPDGVKDFSSLDSKNKFSKEPSMQALLVSETVDVDALNECSTFLDPKYSSGSEIERSLSSAPTPMEDLSKRDSSIDQQYSLAISASKVSPIVDESLSCSGLGLVGPHDAARESPQASDKDIMGGHHKGSTKPRARRSSVKGAGKESSKKGNLTKTVKSLKRSERGEKPGNLLTSPGGFQLVQSNESEHYGHMECGSMQPLVFVTPSTSTLSDLNNSTPPSAMFQQPFTDLQQVELRAQIFVYGALIQGVAPDEACMLSAFGGPDNGRSWWEKAWRMCIERLHGQKSYPISSETSLQSHSGAKVLDEAMKKMTPHSKGISSSPVNRVRSKGTGAVANSMIPPSSPLWNISTPSEALQSVVPKGSVTECQQALSPFLSFQTPPTRNLIGVTTSWLSQAPFLSPWVATSQTTTTEFSSRLSGLPITEPVHLTPQREPFIPQSSGLKHPGLMVHNSVPTIMFPGPSPLFDTKRTSIIHQDSCDPKPRKRKKIPAAEDQSQIVVQSSPRAEQVSFPLVGHGQSPSVSISNSSDFSAKDGSEKLILHVSTMPSTADPKKVDQDVQQRGHITEETLSQVKDARQLAEDACACAAGAVQRGQEIWSQLGRQSYSELESCIQARISSATVAVAAAVAVAKAAAAAAKVASNAALQAKLMAEEAFASTGDENSGPSHDATTNGIMHSVGKDNSVSKLMIDGETNSTIIFAAKEAARKRVEATTAASKQAENMDAIVKAAELAAEAVSQAGKIVAMGEPLPLTELVKVVPGGSRIKIPQLSNEIAIRSDEKQLRLDSFGDCSNSSAKPSKGPSVAKESRVTSRRSPLRGVISKDLIEDQHKLVDFAADAGIITEDDLLGKAHKISDLAKTIGVDPESEFDARSTHVTVEVTGLKDNTINEGSCVEILKDGNGLKAAWFLASVLSLKDAEAYVCYNDLQREKGSGPLMEWVPLESQVDQPPKIRISHPVSAKQFQGTRKRRRAALNDHAWSVGDRVDAWIQDSWREGVVSEKNQKDRTTMTIHFPANGETSVVKIWHLRPSLVWKDGKWVEWSMNHGSESASESDVPREKRLKFGSPLVKAKGKDNIPKLVNVVEPGLEDSRLLVLSANERAFNVGNSGQNENKSYPLRTARTGLQEGSRVIFGVPKPGKKRKFMEVSKHYVGHHYKATEASDSVNFVKKLIPQRSEPSRLKNPPRPVRRENRETENRVKQAIEMKPKGTSKSGKPPNVLDRTLPPRENYMKKVVATPMDGTDSEIHAEKTLRKQLIERGSFSEALETSLAPFGEAPKKMSSSNPKLQRANKGKFAPGEGGKLSKIEENKVWNSNSTQSASEIEPRRSVRRIQPTSRLLEGLQSSLTISKNPSAHEKAKKRLMRPTSKAK